MKLKAILFCSCLIFYAIPGIAACEGADFVLLDEDQLSKTKDFCSRPGLVGIVKQWKPTCKDVTAAERKLPGFLEKLTNSLPLINLHKGFRQYVGFKRDGKKFLFINHGPLDSDIPRKILNRQMFDKCDAGFEVWSVEYDVSSDKVDHFVVSGPEMYPDNFTLLRMIQEQKTEENIKKSNMNLENHE